MKKSFVIHMDSLDVLDHLSDEQAGQLLKAFKAYHQNQSFDLDPILSIAFVPFKNQFERDLEKYESVCYRNKINGMKGGRPKTQRNPKNPDGFSKTQRNPEKPKKPDSDSDNDSDKDSDKTNRSNGFDRFWSVYPKKVKKKETKAKWKTKRLADKADMIIADVQNRIANDARWKAGYIPDPTTYLNGERWEDEIETQRASNENRNPNYRTKAESAWQAIKNLPGGN